MFLGEEGTESLKYKNITTSVEEKSISNRHDDDGDPDNDKL